MSSMGSWVASVLTTCSCLILIPVSAIAVYAVFRSLNLHVPTNVVLYVITMPLGFWFFFRSLWLTIRPRSA